MAMWQRQPKAGLIVHSDQGVQYASHQYRRLLKLNGFIGSMSKKGCCWDNAVAESFFHTLKTELVHHEDYRSRAESKASLFEYIEVFYNHINNAIDLVPVGINDGLYTYRNLHQFNSQGFQIETFYNLYPYFEWKIGLVW